MSKTEKSCVGFTRVEGSGFLDLKMAIKNCIELIHFQYPQNIRNVVIKPNMCYYWDYSTGHTTNPLFVGALIDVLREEISPDINISIVESDASAMECKYAFPFLGYTKLAEKYKVNLVNLSEDTSENVEVAVNGKNFNFQVPLTIRDADLRINVPKIKYMYKVRISSAMKNLYGCNPFPQKYRYHPKLEETIVALNKIMKFQLHILDGLVLLGTIPQKLNLVMASQDPVAFDSAASRIAGENPKRVKCITLGEKESLGNLLFKRVGLDPIVFQKEYPKKKKSEKLITLAYNLAVKARVLPNN